ncbi:putative cutinase 3 [Eremomyces bilateralis CBS 781.70]|uniref:Cutinase n=1 Tax=Eremomyces bilateralis CBS 781.70 TaxID=1392243 RepID=A0A6G1FZW5_9PEZI|nr:putative cutinase 3 [Eremomyces bilateralis CBS 781.70]KAF1811272.1 putative cutinase 3 [Eremomyces bilateralis CBS 781.70]
MKSLLSIVALAATAAAAPTGDLETRQIGRCSMTCNELERGSCAEVIFIMARASTEPGNMGMSVGPAVCSDLKRAHNTICQGVGGAYTAGLADNFGRLNTSPAAIQEATKIFNQAVQKCPQSVIVAGGYSQGTAVMHNTISGLPPNIQEKIAGVVLFGDTRNEQDNGQIPNFPREKVKIFCNTGDLVCSGSLTITMSHFMYSGDVPDAVRFLSQQIGGGGGGSSGGSGLGGLLGGGSSGGFGGLFGGS